MHIFSEKMVFYQISKAEWFRYKHPCLKLVLCVSVFDNNNDKHDVNFQTLPYGFYGASWKNPSPSCFKEILKIYEVT